MGFRRQMHDGIRLFRRQQRRHAGRIADVELDKTVARIIRHRGQRFQVAGIGQLIQVHHLDAFVRHQRTHHRRPDKARSPGDDDFHGTTLKEPLTHRGFRRQTQIRLGAGLAANIALFTF